MPSTSLPSSLALAAFLLCALGAGPIAAAPELKIVDKPIRWNAERERLTIEYRHEHYGEENATSTIDPRIIVVHHTAVDTFKGSFRAFNGVKLRGRKDIVKASPLNVSTHFLVDRDGTVYQLMPTTRMGRHTIGINWAAVSIENVGGKKLALTDAQLRANAALVRHLKQQHPALKLMIGHHEYTRLRGTPWFKERDVNYLTSKRDPGPGFMRQLRALTRDVELAGPPPAPRPVTWKGSAKRLNPFELEKRTLRELSLTRNEIFARHGRAFHTEWVRAHFEKQPWYRVDPDYSPARLTPLDRENVKLVVRVEEALGPAQLRLRRNAVYARHGRAFQSKDLRAHFTKKPWYKPDPGYSDARLTDEDRVEIELIQGREQKLGAHAAIRDWKPGTPLKLRNLEDNAEHGALTIEDLMVFYERLYVELNVRRPESGCWNLELQRPSSPLCEPPRKSQTPRRKLAPVDRQALREVERAFPILFVLEDFHTPPTCDDECGEIFAGDRAAQKAERVACHRECKGRIQQIRARWKRDKKEELAYAKENPLSVEGLLEGLQFRVVDEEDAFFGGAA